MVYRLSLWASSLTPLPFFILISGIQLLHQMLQRTEYPFVIHPLWSDDTNGAADALAKFIVGGDHAAVRHGLERCLIPDVNLDSIVVFRFVYICNEFLELILLFEGADQLACFLAIAQLWIFEDVGGTAGVDLKIFLIGPDGSGHLI